MTVSTNMTFWLFCTILTFIIIYLLAPILTPFLLGALLAYLINPIVKMLERKHIPHLLSVVFVFVVFLSSVTLLVLMLSPYVIVQIESFVAFIPKIYEWLQSIGLPWLMQHINLETVKSALPATLSKTGLVVSTFLKSGIVAIQSIVSVVLTPVVTFYLLRDWDKVINNCKQLLPRTYAPTIIQLAKDCDEVLSAFVRGQLLVMLCLSFIYSTGLILIGLQFGLIIGLIGGLLSIVPYLGSSFVLISSLIAAFMQSGIDNTMAYALLVFVIGQTTEGYILTPYLIGDRIGLHPVAVIFAIMAGGTLFGFFGILLALPVAAILMVTFRFFRKKYAYGV